MSTLILFVNRGCFGRLGEGAAPLELHHLWSQYHPRGLRRKLVSDRYRCSEFRLAVCVRFTSPAGNGNAHPGR